MNSENPFRAPSAVVADVSETGELELAGRGHRFGASMIDAVVASLFFFPLGVALGTYHFGQTTRPSVSASIGMTLLGFLIFVITQSYFLKKSGQTIGKKIVGIRIVDLDENVPSLGTLLGRRYAPLYLAQGVPGIGWVLSMLDVLFIFRQDRRCVHDLIAKTKVVLCGARHSSTTWFVLPFVLIMVLGIGAAILIPMFQGYNRLHAKPPVTAQPAAKPAAQTPSVGTGTNTGAANPATADAAPPPASPPAANDTSRRASDADLRKCLELKDPAAIIRCSEAANK